MKLFKSEEQFHTLNQNLANFFGIQYQRQDYKQITIEKMPHYEDGCRLGIGGAPKGRIPWNKGKKGLQKATEETRKKMRESSARKGKPPHNKGIPMSDIAKEKASKSISAARKSKFWSTKKINPQ
jgi:hypothetical protein